MKRGQLEYLYNHENVDFLDVLGNEDNHILYHVQYPYVGME